jgi:hypothetical protein
MRELLIKGKSSRTTKVKGITHTKTIIFIKIQLKSIRIKKVKAKMITKTKLKKKIKRFRKK